MTFWDERTWFERTGEQYVFRTSAFSRGYTVSEDEKDRLFQGLTQLSVRLLWEGVAWLGAIAAVVLAGWLDFAALHHWFQLMVVIVIGVLAVTGTVRQKRLIRAVLGDREPDVPRRSFAAAASTPRQRVNPQVAVPVLRCLIVLIWICLAVLNGAFGYLVYSVWQAGQRAAEAGGPVSHSGLSAQALSNPQFWGGLAAVNVVTALCALLLMREVRRLSRLDEAGADRG